MSNRRYVALLAAHETVDSATLGNIIQDILARDDDDVVLDLYVVIWYLYLVGVSEDTSNRQDKRASDSLTALHLVGFARHGTSAGLVMHQAMWLFDHHPMLISALTDSEPVRDDEREHPRRRVRRVVREIFRNRGLDEQALLYPERIE